jgi:hypothetical protein
MIAGDIVLKNNVINFSFRDRFYVKADDLQGAGQTAFIINTSVFDEAPLSITESSE